MVLGMLRRFVPFSASLDNNSSSPPPPQAPFLFRSSGVHRTKLLPKSSSAEKAKEVLEKLPESVALKAGLVALMERVVGRRS